MKRVFLMSSVLLFLGCADKPLATSVTQLAGNQEIVGWKDEKVVQKPKIIERTVYISPKPKLVDSDGDGVIDSLDKCPNTPKNLVVDHNGCPIITTLRFNFDYNSAKVKKVYYPQIKKIAEVLKQNPLLKIKIAGYTDDRGSEKYNLELSFKRAKAIKDILVKKYHISPNRIVVKGYGEAYPLVPNDSETNRALNRRVEIVNITNSRYTFPTDGFSSVNTSLDDILKNTTKNSKKISNKNKKRKKSVKNSKKIESNKKSQSSTTKKPQLIIPPIF